jgi:uncharacterized protein
VETPIGRALDRSRLVQIAAAGVGAVTVAGDLLSYTGHRWGLPCGQWPLPLAAIVLLAALARWDRGGIGLRLRPLQGARYWIKAALLIGLGVLALAGVAFLVARWLGWRVDPGYVDRARLPYLYLWSCIYVPIVEEGIYRLALCAPAVSLLRPWGTIVLSGAVFAAYHFVVRNPGPDNFVAGYFLAWAYLKSGSLLVPIALHSLGNTFALLLRLARPWLPL